jgi:hypothetical protein
MNRGGVTRFPSVLPSASQIVNIIRVFHLDNNLFKMTLRALGNLSYCDENIRFLVDNGAIDVIVQGMTSHPSDKQAQQFALEVRVACECVPCVCACGAVCISVCVAWGCGFACAGAFALCSRWLSTPHLPLRHVLTPPHGRCMVAASVT